MTREQKRLDGEESGTVSLIFREIRGARTCDGNRANPRETYNSRIRRGPRLRFLQ